MKLIANLTLLASLFLATTTVLAQEPEAVHKAEDAANRWLALVDAGDYAQSWDQGASAFQAAVSKSAWTSAIQSARAPFGIMKARTRKAASYTKTLPGAPAGEYVVIQYSSQFANGANAIETVTPMLDKDGTWKVSGYFIK